MTQVWLTLVSGVLAYWSVHDAREWAKIAFAIMSLAALVLSFVTFAVNGGTTG